MVGMDDTSSLTFVLFAITLVGAVALVGKEELSSRVAFLAAPETPAFGKTNRLRFG